MAKPKKSLPDASDINIADLKNKTAAERALILMQGGMSKKFPTAKIFNGKTIDETPLFIEVPDLSMQYALGRVGYACGRINYILGFEGSSKTTNLLWKINLALKQGGLAALVEWENALDPDHIAYYVEEPEKLQIWKADSLEEGMEMTRELLKIFGDADPDGLLPKIIGADSIGGSIMKRALEDKHEIGDARVGGSGLYMSAAVGLINNLCARTNTLWCPIGQAREEIPTGFSGPPKADLEKIVAKGGKALPFHSTYWEVLKRGATLKGDSGKTGFTVRSTFKKNKKGVQFREYTYDVEFYKGLNFSQHTMDFLSLGHIGGLQEKKNRFWCEPMGISESDKKEPEEMYAIVHSPQHIGRFQEALGIRRDMHSIAPTPVDKPQVSDEELMRQMDEQTQAFNIAKEHPDQERVAA